MMIAVAAVVALTCSAPQPGGAPRPPGGGPPLKPEPVPVSAAQVFRDLRDSIQIEPIAERLTVTVRSEQTPVSANIVLRIAPGAQRDLRDARVSVEAGPLRVYARGGTEESPGEVTAVSASNAAVYYRVPLTGPPTLKALSDALMPLPLPTLAFCFAPEGAVADPTPLTRGIRWEGTVRNPLEPFAPLTLTGVMEGKPEQPVTLALEYPQKRLRLRSFTAPLSGGGGSARTLQIVAAPLEPGDPAGWVIDVTGRTRVETLAGLGAQPHEPAKTDSPKPDAPKKDDVKPEPPPAPAKVGPEP